MSPSKTDVASELRLYWFMMAVGSAEFTAAKYSRTASWTSAVESLDCTEQAVSPAMNRVARTARVARGMADSS